ncbi:hypothetical protein [Subtercola frigoramans]|uniref:Uncharacterized protein n=1 Tax=Subtercola frigoramans TaxID=120298 RepID=A0ABS2L0H2_9MICO|nr:hypothetical protein [Subtercola frigoramans]MBM7470564.1 hypothetical protein [Subtercola frigoramans]
MNADSEAQYEPAMAGTDEPRHDDTDQPDARRGDPDQLPDGSASDANNSEDGVDTASGGGADDE